MLFWGIRGAWEPLPSVHNREYETARCGMLRGGHPWFVQRGATGNRRAMNEASLATQGTARGTNGQRLTMAVMRVSELQT